MGFGSSELFEDHIVAEEEKTKLVFLQGSK